MKFGIGEIATLWHPEPGSDGQDFSFLHGEEVEIVGYADGQDHDYDYWINIPSFSPEHALAKESELRKKKDDYDGNDVVTWDDCVWSPAKELETVE